MMRAFFLDDGRDHHHVLRTPSRQGLSEPAGALIALLAVGPYLTPEGLQLLLATVGGIMTAVCVVELLPEGRKCALRCYSRWRR